MNAQGADVVAVGRAQRRSGVESDPRLTRDEGVLGEPPILVGVEHDHGLTDKNDSQTFSSIACAGSGGEEGTDWLCCRITWAQRDGSRGPLSQLRPPVII